MKSRKVRTAIVGVLMFLFVFSAYALIAQEAAEKADPKIEQMRAGKNFIPTKVYSAEEDQKILKLYEGLRVADVVDGMDKAGLRNVGAMAPAIHPSWTDTKTFKHRFIGIALTVRNAPVNWPLPPKMNTKEFDEYQDKHYSTTAAEPFVDLIRPGTAVVIDDSLGYDVGPVGSFNIMVYKSKGCVGVVTDATARDLDEVAAQNIPLYIREPGRRIRPGRNQTESVNMPIVCGGVLVMPGDVILADGDGVLCVPRAYAKEVADYARATLQMDMPRRKEMYEKLGIPLDDSVK